MTRIEATDLVPAPREAVFAFLSALENHWVVAGRWIEVLALAPAPAGATRGHVRIRGPLGLRRTAATQVEESHPPHGMRGTARLGRTRVEVHWSLQAAPAGTRVRLGARVVSAGALDRALLALGGAAWMRRLFAATLTALAARFQLGAGPRPAAASPRPLSRARA